MISRLSSGGSSSGRQLRADDKQDKLPTGEYKSLRKRRVKVSFKRDHIMFQQCPLVEAAALNDAKGEVSDAGQRQTAVFLKHVGEIRSVT